RLRKAVKQQKRWPRTADDAGEANFASVDLQGTETGKERRRRVSLWITPEIGDGCHRIRRTRSLVQTHVDFLSRYLRPLRSWQAHARTAPALRKKGCARCLNTMRADYSCEWILYAPTSLSVPAGHER